MYVRCASFTFTRRYCTRSCSGAYTECEKKRITVSFDVLEEDAAKRAEAEKKAESNSPDDKRLTKFIKGRLVSVDCSPSPAAVLTVTADGSTLKLRAEDYKSLVLIGVDDFSCDWHDRQVTVNYKPGGPANGELISLEMR